MFENPSEENWDMGTDVDGCMASAILTVSF